MSEPFDTLNRRYSTNHTDAQNRSLNTSDFYARLLQSTLPRNAQWQKHTVYHFSHEMPTGDRLSFWPGPNKWSWDGQTMHGKHLLDVCDYITEACKICYAMQDEASGLVLVQGDEIVGDAAQAADVLIKEFEDAVHALAWKGAQHPGDWGQIEREYAEAKAALLEALTHV